MKKFGFAIFIASIFVTSTAIAEEGQLLVRLRAVDIQVDNGNSSTTVVPALGKVEVENKWIPEVDFTYFFTENLATELILTYPQKHEVKFAGTRIGSVKHLPPTLTLQYHFLPQNTVRPYVGVGVNYTRFTTVNLNAASALGGLDTPLGVDRNSLGLAGQVGVDFQLASNLFINLDVKYVQIKANNIHVSGGTLAGTKVTDLDVNPVLLSVGFGYRF